MGRGRGAAPPRALRPHGLRRAARTSPPEPTSCAPHLAGLPVAAGIDLTALARSTGGFSGADLALVCRTAGAGGAARRRPAPGEERPIAQADLEAARAGIAPSTTRWFDGARNVVLFADQSGEFAPLAAHMRTHRML